MNIVFAQFNISFLQHEGSMITEQELEPRTRHMLWFLRQPGVAAWWRENQGMFSQGFRDYVEKSGAEDTLREGPSGRAGGK